MTRIAENRVASSARARLTVVVMGSPRVKEQGDGRAAWLDSHLGVRCSQYLERMGRDRGPVIQTFGRIARQERCLDPASRYGVGSARS